MGLVPTLAEGFQESYCQLPEILILFDPLWYGIQAVALPNADCQMP